MNVGTLTIEMAANVARLQKDMEHAKRTVDGAIKHIRSAASAAGTALAALGLGLSAGAFGLWVKNAINAADETSKLAAKMGVATNQVGGLQLAFQLSGMEAGALQTSMSKLAVGIAGGNDALKAMGISTKDANGNLKSSRAVLGEVADKFAGYRDGAGKAALAVELFGKTGANMIPLLNGGAKALDEFDAMAAKLGLTIDEETAKNAEAFNDTLDLIGMSGQGVARQIAAQLLPTLSGLAEQFLSNITQGDKLKRVADGLSAVLKGLYVVGLGVVEVFKTVGNTLGGLVAAAVAAVGGDFKGAGQILRELRADIGSGWKETLSQMESAWNATGSAAVESMAATAGATKRAAASVEDFKAKQEAAEKAAVAARKKAVDDAKRAAEEVKKAEKQWADEQSRRAIEAVKRYEAEEEAANERIKSAKDLLSSIQDEASLLDLSNQEREITIAMRKLETQGVVKGTEAYNEYADAIRKAIIDRETTRESIEQAEQIKRDWEKTTEQIGQSLSDALMEGGRSAGEYIKGLFRNMVLRPIIQAGVQQVFGSSGSGGGVLGSLGGAGGGSPFNLVSTLSSAANFLKGGSLMGQAGSMIGSFGSAIGSQTLAQFGTGMQGATLAAGAAGPTTAGASGAMGLGASAARFVPIVGWILAGMLANGSAYDRGWRYNTKDLPKVLQPLGTAYDTVMGGPLLDKLFGGKTAAMLTGSSLVARVFGRKAPEVERQGIEGTFGPGGFAGNSFADIVRKGGWLRSDKRWTDRAALESATRDALSGSFDGLRASVADLASSLGQPTEQIANYSKTIRLVFGSDQAANQKLIDDKFTAMGEDMARMVLGGAASVTQQAGPVIGGLFGKILEMIRSGLSPAGVSTDPLPFQRAGETAMQTLQRLAGSLQTVNQGFSVLGRTLLDASFAGGDFASKVADAFGGLDGFTGSIHAYFEAIYSDSEKLASAQAQLQRAFDALGVAIPATDAAYRALVEAQDISTDQGLKMYSALVQLAPAFAQVRDVLDEQARAAVEAAAAAQEEAAQRAAAINEQRLGLEEQLLQLQGDTAELRRRELEALDPSNRALQMLINSMEDAAVAAEEQARAASDAAEQARQAEEQAQRVRDAWGDIGKTIADEIRRIRGVATGGAAGYAAIASQFSVATAQARAGDQDAARMLPGLSRDLLDAAAAQATTTSEFAVVRGRVAGSLEGTLEVAARMFDSQSIVTELQQLRAEVQLLRVEAQATAGYTNKTARILDRAMQDGESLNVSADGGAP